MRLGFMRRIGSLRSRNFHNLTSFLPQLFFVPVPFYVLTSFFTTFFTTCRKKLLRLSLVLRLFYPQIRERTAQICANSFYLFSRQKRRLQKGKNPGVWKSVVTTCANSLLVRYCSVLCSRGSLSRGWRFTIRWGYDDNCVNWTAH